MVRLGSGDRCVVADGSLVVGDPVELSIRPEAVELSHSTSTATGPAPIAATVEQVAYLGGNVQYIVRTAGGLSITALVPKTRDRLPVGGAVDVRWSPAEALVLAAPPNEPQPEEVRA